MTRYVEEQLFTHIQFVGLYAGITCIGSRRVKWNGEGSVVSVAFLVSYLSLPCLLILTRAFQANGYIMQMLSQVRGPTDQPSVQHEAMQLLVAVFSTPGCMFVKRKKYIDSYIRYEDLHSAQGGSLFAYIFLSPWELSSHYLMCRLRVPFLKWFLRLPVLCIMSTELF